jgi:hypothetical protein
MEGVNAIPGKRGFERLQVHRVGGHGQFTENPTFQAPPRGGLPPAWRMTLHR